jgi:hypothetical protein
VDWGKDLLFFEAEGQGSRINVPLDIQEGGRYEIVARIAQAPDYGDYYALLDGKPTNLDNRQAATSEIPSTGPEVFDNYLPEIYVALDRPLGWLDLEKGRHTLSFVCVGRGGRSSGYNLGINDVVLERIPRAIAVAPQPPLSSPLQTGGTVYRGRPLSAYLQQLKQASNSNRAEIVRAIGAFSEDAGPAVKAVAEALTDPDPDTRAAAAWALSQMAAAGALAIPALEKAIADVNPRVRSLSAAALRSMGPKAVDAVPVLVQALSDPAAYVRAPAADAIGSIGSTAKAAVQPLIERLLTTGEQVYVLRSVASALGNIGPDAAGALPALEQALKMHRVTYTAQEAILKIKKEPVPTWF